MITIAAHLGLPEVQGMRSSAQMHGYGVPSHDRLVSTAGEIYDTMRAYIRLSNHATQDQSIQCALMEEYLKGTGRQSCSDVDSRCAFPC